MPGEEITCIAWRVEGGLAKRKLTASAWNNEEYENISVRHGAAIYGREMKIKYLNESAYLKPGKSEIVALLYHREADETRGIWK